MAEKGIFLTFFFVRKFLFFRTHPSVHSWITNKQNKICQIGKHAYAKRRKGHVRGRKKEKKNVSNSHLLGGGVAEHGRVSERRDTFRSQK